MKKKIQTILTHPLISGSMIVFIGTFIGNIFNFFFNLFMTRNLSLSDYGILASLISLITLFALAAESCIPTVVRFAGTYYAKNDLDMVRGLFFRVSKIALAVGFGILLVLTVFSGVISEFFKISDHLMIFIAGLCILFSFLGVITRALLQAKLSFGTIGLLSLFSSILKFVLGLSLVYIGYRVYGAIWAYFSAFIIPYLVSFIPLRFLLSSHVKVANVPMKTLFQYGGPSALALLGLTSLISTDIMLVKHFYSPHDAGLYAGLSLVGKVIFFFSAPIGTVMFPLVVQKHTKGENYHKDFHIAMLLVLLPSASITIFYFLFPTFAITFFIKQQAYIEVAKYLGFFGLFITAYSLLSIIINFYLSIHKTKVYIPVVIAAIVQAILIWFFHGSFGQIIGISLGVTVVLLILLLLYYGKQKK